MSEARELTRLRAQLDAMRVQRDSALRALEGLQDEIEERLRLLTEEQDRFVSRLFEAHEQELGQARAELEEARKARNHLEEKLQYAEREAIAARENWLSARSLIDRLRSQANQAAMVCRSLTHERDALSVRTNRLEAELDLARSVLALAIDGSDSHRETMALRPLSQPSTAESWRSSGVAPRKTRTETEGSPQTLAPQAARRKRAT